jgi:hypothetical protein
MRHSLPATIAILVAISLAACAGTGKTGAAASAVDVPAAEAALTSFGSASAPVGLTPSPEQEEAAQAFLYHLLSDHRDSLAELFVEEVRPQVTGEIMKTLREQITWIYRFIGGEFELFHSGGADSNWFREYRMANESNKRSPMLVVHLVFEDPVAPGLTGAQVKNFMGGEKRVAGEQVWEIGDREFDIHSIITVEVQAGNLMAVQFYDEDVDEDVDRDYVADRAVPLIREAIARGYADSARVVLEGKPLLDEVGVVFIRRDRREGFVHFKVSFRPEEYNADRETLREMMRKREEEMMNQGADD